MIKNVVLFFAFVLSVQSAFAIDKKELNIDFFSRFNDDCLVYYINSALDNNHDAKQAAAGGEKKKQAA